MSKFDKEKTAVIVGVYEADAVGNDYEARTAVVKSIAVANKVSENVIRGVLVAEGVYMKKEVAAKAATGGKSKADIVKAVEAVMGIKLASMDKMTVKDLTAFWDRFVEMSERVNVGAGK